MHKTLWRETLSLWLYTFLNIPMIFWVRPRILDISDSRAVLLIRYRRRTKNHVNSMYFGALCVGADLAPGILTMQLLRKQPGKYSFVFKDVQAEFLKRCEGDVHFTCDEGHLIAETIQKVRDSKERHHVMLNVVATVPSRYGAKPVCRFKLTLSIKQHD